MTKVFVFLQAVVDFQLYLNNKGIFSYTNPISTKIPSQRQKTHKKYAVRYLKDTINAIKLKDAFCISNRNISGKLLPSSFLKNQKNKNNNKNKFSLRQCSSYLQFGQSVKFQTLSLWKWRFVNQRRRSSLIELWRRDAYDYQKKNRNQNKVSVSKCSLVISQL